MKINAAKSGIESACRIIGAMAVALGFAMATAPTWATDMLCIARTNNDITLSWQFPGVLQSAGAIAGEWADMPEAVAGLTAPCPNSAMSFFRVRQPRFTIVDTGQTNCYGDAAKITAPAPGQPFHGQDAQYVSPAPAYTNNGNGTITDLNTGLMWVQPRGAKMTWDAAVAGAATNLTGGHADWRMPTIKELYSLIKFTGVNGPGITSTAGYVPFIDTNYFGFAYGSGVGSERVIDCQDWSATPYVSTTMNGDATIFGVNFADGRIKGYPKYTPGSGGTTGQVMFVRYVRGNPAYGTNNFVDNADGTVTDLATALMWSQADSAVGLSWSNALAWVQARNAANFLGHSDWRLPNAKELESIVDYARSPATTGSAAIDPIFGCTAITNEGGQTDYPFFWAGTTHLDGSATPLGVYVCFGRALGWMQLPPTFSWQLLDVHGAGAQRSDPKSGDPTSYPHGHGPQGDVVRINNFVRLVRGGLTQ